MVASLSALVLACCKGYQWLFGTSGHKIEATIMFDPLEREHDDGREERQQNQQDLDADRKSVV